MSFHVKICGLKDPAMAAHAVAAGADMIGLVFFPRSPRNVSPSEAADVAAEVRGETNIVGLFVNPDLTLLADVLAEVPLTHIQLHGSETPERVSKIAEEFGLPVIKAAGVHSPEEVTAAEEAYSDIADMLVFDAKPPKLATHPGGNGVAFDPAILAGVMGQTPWLISGGLMPETVFDTVDCVRMLPGFAGVDVSSGVESAPGVKDADRISAFIGAARAAMSDYMDKDA